MPERGPRRLGAEALWKFALTALGARAHSIGELREKLGRRAQRAGDVDSILSRLKQSGYLNDRSYAESYSAARLENQGLGKIRVLRDLRRRRVAPPVAERAVEAAYRGSDEIKLIEDFVRRKYRKARPEAFLADPRDLAAAYRRLLRAGFGPANVIQTDRKSVV